MNDLTIVIPSLNRQNEILRQIQVWKYKPVTIHILDGTYAPLMEMELEDLGNDIHYHHLPDLSIETRLQGVLPKLNTPFTVLLGDDETYEYETVEKCIQYLKNHPDYVACIGQCRGVYRDRQREMYPLLKGYDLCHDDPDMRMIRHMDPYVPSTMYAIHRTSVWKRNIQLMGQYTSSYVNEILFELSSVYQGKSCALPDVMWLRNMVNKPIQTTRHDRRLEFDVWIRSPRYIDESVRFFDAGMNMLGDCFSEAVHAYLRFCDRHRLKRRLWYMKRYLLNMLGGF